MSLATSSSKLCRSVIEANCEDCDVSALSRPLFASSFKAARGPATAKNLSRGDGAVSSDSASGRSAWFCGASDTSRFDVPAEGGE